MDLTSFIALYCFLAYFSVMDVRYRYLPLVPTLLFVVTSVATACIRASSSDQLTLSVLSLSLLLSGIVSATMLYLVHASKMVGIGDVTVLLFSSVLTPYVPYPDGARLFPFLTPLATAIAVAMVYTVMLKNTVYVSNLPPGFRRVRVHKAFEIKRSNVVKEYPVFVEGLGFVFDRLFASSPSENVTRLLSEVPDDATVYTLPNFPFVFYFTLGHVVATALLIVLQFFT